MANLTELIWAHINEMGLTLTLFFVPFFCKKPSFPLKKSSLCSFPSDSLIFYHKPMKRHQHNSFPSWMKQRPVEWHYTSEDSSTKPNNNKPKRQSILHTSKVQKTKSNLRLINCVIQLFSILIQFFVNQSLHHVPAVVPPRFFSEFCWL